MDHTYTHIRIIIIYLFYNCCCFLLLLFKLFFFTHTHIIDDRTARAYKSFYGLLLLSSYTPCSTHTQCTIYSHRYYRPLPLCRPRYPFILLFMICIRLTRVVINGVVVVVPKTPTRPAQIGL